ESHLLGPAGLSFLENTRSFPDDGRNTMGKSQTARPINGPAWTRINVSCVCCARSTMEKGVVGPICVPPGTRNRFAQPRPGIEARVRPAIWSDHAELNPCAR